MKKHEQSSEPSDVRRRPGRPPSRDSLYYHRTQKEKYLAELRRMEVERKRGMLLERADVLATWSNILRMVRARVLAVAPRVRARLTHLTAQDAQVIDEELRIALTDLGEDRATPLP